MRILIYGQRVADEQLPYVKQLLDAIAMEDVELAVFEPFIDAIKPQITFKAQPIVIASNKDFDRWLPDFVFTLGGDGTILSAVTLIRDRQIPVLGINMGRLGFLASIENKFAADAIKQLARGMYVVEDRTMLYLETSGDIFGENRFALNDFTLHKRDTSSMMIIKTYINGDFLTSYWADGLIVATPTGSTAYSLSCGGPIIFPKSGNFVITPVAPHNLNVRPIVVSDDSVISFEIEGRSANYLATLDSRFELVTPELQLAVRKSDFATRIVIPDNYSFMKTMHDKLTWGADSRN